MNRLAGKTALVTGGTRGIGCAIVEAFLAEGARVAFAGASEASVGRAALPGSAEGIAADLGDPAAPGRLVAEAAARLGRIDILVNNAGVVSRATEWELTPEEWDRIHDVNLRAVFFLSQAAARLMRDQGGGSILNLSSIAGQHGGLAGSPAYASAKAAVIGLTRSLARRFAPAKIRVNCIAPADIETDMTAAWPQELRERLIALTPLGRFAAVDEVSGAAVFLASDEASFITGQTLSVNGGAYMS
jgi:NAD(P)-dependent dehydrogenase (short-subunit alcohol dehydrogenase family)